MRDRRHSVGMQAAMRAGAVAIGLLLVAMMPTLGGGATAAGTRSVAAATASPPITLRGGAPGAFLGVASCAGSTCHGRLEPDGAIVRQDELRLWQEPSTPAGAHSRAFAVLNGTRARAIAATLGMGDPAAAPACLGCHSTPDPSPRGPVFLTKDGVSCEGCHGPAGGWIASHYTVGASHAANVARGMTALDRPAVRARVCLDCHYGSARAGQFVSHRMMAAGHPRLSFELDLFSTLQLHHNEDADYVARKGRSDPARTWAVGQALAVAREMALFADPARGSEGAFPEFTFFDCHSCHRRIFDQADRVKTWEANPGRPIPAGMPPFNDENMILLAAAARVAAPGMAARLDADSRAFHAAFARDRASAVAAARRLGATADALAGAMDKVGGAATAFAMVDAIAAPMLAARFTDYAGSAQSVMAIDTLLNALVREGRVTVGAAAGIRADINRAYAAVKDPNGYRPADFRAALASAARAIRALR